MGYIFLCTNTHASPKRFSWSCLWKDTKLNFGLTILAAKKVFVFVFSTKQRNRICMKNKTRKSSARLFSCWQIFYDVNGASKMRFLWENFLMHNLIVSYPWRFLQKHPNQVSLWFRSDPLIFLVLPSTSCW